MFRSLLSPRIAIVGARQSAAVLAFSKQIHNTAFLRNSLFGQVTEGKTDTTALEPEKQQDVSEITPATDAALQEYYLEEAKKSQIASDKYITPLKKKLFEQNVKQNGFFKNNQVVTDVETGKVYKLSLTPEEIDILEPSIYLLSYRIKSSIKKANIVNRFVRGYNVKTAINQLHFNPKKMSTELEKLLKRGLEQAREMNVDEDKVFIHALWVGSDGRWAKRADPKGRGRTGIIEHTYIHVKAILKTEQTTLRKNWEKQQKELVTKPRMFLNNEPLNFKVTPYYKW